MAYTLTSTTEEQEQDAINRGTSTAGEYSTYWIYPFSW